MPVLARFCQSERGAVAPIVALLLVVLLGFAGLGIEVGLWQLEKRRMQGAADAAASSAAQAIMKGDSESQQARAIAATFGYQNGIDDVTVVVNRPPLQGSKAGVADAVEVVIRKNRKPMLAGFFMDGDVELGARAVASVEGSGGGFCVLALEVTAQATQVHGASTINLPDCGLAVNSANPQAIIVTGSASITATHVSVVGNYVTYGVARINTTVAPHPETGQAPLADPYADVEVPAFSGCNYNNYHLGSNHKATLYPGVYCNGLRVDNDSDATLMPGIYIIDRGTFTVAGSARFKAYNGVTFILTSSTGNNFPSIYQEGATTMHIEAPTTGPFAGIAIYQDRRAPTWGNNRFTGSTKQNIVGAIYLPRQQVTWEGVATPTVGKCVHLVARTLVINGSANFGNACANKGVREMGERDAALFE